MVPISASAAVRELHASGETDNGLAFGGSIHADNAGGGAAGTGGLQSKGKIHKSVGVSLASVLFGAFLAVLLVVPAGSAHGQDGAPTAQPAAVSADTPIGTAAALLGEGQWEAAFAILRPLAAHDARAGTLLFETGMVSLGLAHHPGIGEAERDAFLDVSIAAFQAILAASPDQTRVRLELARAFFLKGQDGLARRHFERVLAGDVPAPVVANVNRFLDEIRARRRWSAYGGIGLAPDTNIGAARPSGRNWWTPRSGGFPSPPTRVRLPEWGCSFGVAGSTSGRWTNARGCVSAATSLAVNMRAAASTG